MSQHSDLIVVGAGPVGLSFCRSLADSGLSITIVDPHSQAELANPAYDGREIALTHPSKKILENLGIWQRFSADDIFKLKQARVLNGNSDNSLFFPPPIKDSKHQKIDNLGFFVSNHKIRQAAYESVASLPNITWKLNLKVTSAYSDDDKATVILENGEQLNTNLLIAADSRFSSIRQQVGIASDIVDYGRTVMVFRLHHEKSNHQTALECFLYGSTLGFLPLSEHISNCVITIETRKAQAIRDMSSSELEDYVSTKTNHRFGQLKIASDIVEYPLVGVHAQSFYTKHCALIGDAACGMHPVTAQGFNLGLQSQDILSGLILNASINGQDISNQLLLRQYNLRHQKDTRVLYHGTNLIVKLFTDDRLPSRIVRDGIINASNRLSPLKKLITRRLTG